MSLLTYKPEYGCHLVQLHCHCPIMLTRPQAVPLAMITMRKSIHRFTLLSYMGMGLHLVAIQATRTPL